MESKASALTASAPMRAWQLPPGTEWPKVRIDFISDEVINVSCDEEDPADLSPTNSA